MTYLNFLYTKIEIAPDTGFELAPSEIHPALKPHQRDAVVWALKGGRRALFESFGLGKTIQELEWCRQVVKHEGGKALIILPLGVRQEFTHDAVQLLGMDPPKYVRTMEEVKAADGEILMTNYERVRHGDIDPHYFTATSLDEASVLRSYKGEFYRFEHSVSNAQAHGQNIKYGSDVFAQLVLTLEDIARMTERGIYELQTWIVGLKALPAKQDIPECFTVLQFDTVPESEKAITDRFRQLSKSCHPDSGGSAEMFQRLTAAKNEAIQYIQEANK